MGEPTHKRVVDLGLRTVTYHLIKLSGSFGSTWCGFGCNDSDIKNNDKRKPICQNCVKSRNKAQNR